MMHSPGRFFCSPRIPKQFSQCSRKISTMKPSSLCLQPKNSENSPTRFERRSSLLSVDSSGHKTDFQFGRIKSFHGTQSDSHFYNESLSSFVKGNIIDGTSIAKEIREEIKAEIESMIAAQPKRRKPHLSVIIVGNDLASTIYVRNKMRAAIETGISCDIIRLPDKVTEEDLLAEISFLNSDDTVDGVIVQLPLPGGFCERTVCDSVLPEKDVDGFNVLNVGRFCVDEEAFLPATPAGVVEILKRLKIETTGKNAVVIGRSKNVGLPIALHLHSTTKGNTQAGNATTTICHRHTPKDRLREHVRNADILVSATGIPGLVTSDMVREGVVVIDIGISRVEQPNGKYRLVGDVDFEGVKEKASLITPVPGGVGPVTIAMVLKNTMTAYKKEIDFYKTANFQT